jgi:hypothetical protein
VGEGAGAVGGEALRAICMHNMRNRTSTPLHPLIHSFVHPFHSIYIHSFVRSFHAVKQTVQSIYAANPFSPCVHGFDAFVSNANQFVLFLTESGVQGS